jgi:hypothetical protein
MIEQLDNRRVMLYEWFADGKSEKEGKFVMINKLHMYPYNIEPHTPFLTLNTPCLKKYIDFDEQINSWVIKCTRTQRILHKIPRIALFMNGKETPSLMMRRFKWIDSRFFKYLTPGGIERLIDTEDEFKEVNYNVI